METYQVIALKSLDRIIDLLEGLVRFEEMIFAKVEENNAKTDERYAYVCERDRLNDGWIEEQRERWRIWDRARVADLERAREREAALDERDRKSQAAWERYFEQIESRSAAAFALKLYAEKCAQMAVLQAEFDRLRAERP